jgi:hypothetical protein
MTAIAELMDQLMMFAGGSGTHETDRLLHRAGWCVAGR